MIKIAHLADIHIRNLKYHDVYRDVFANLYKKLKKQAPNYIVVCGDIAHTKTQISPEYVKMAADFFISLADIAPTIIIPGNHDGLVKNVSRLDAISPIVENITHKNLYFTRNSKVISFKDIEFYHLSIFDRDNWPAPSSNKKIKVALYHGAISNVKTDVGFVLTHGDDEINIFNGFDFGMLGDIHKTNQILDTQGTVRYPGSLISQNFGETNDKGYLFWEIKSPEDFVCDHIQIENPKPFITVVLTPKGRLPKKLDLPIGSRLRIVSEHHISLDAMKRAIDIVKMKFKPESVSYLNRASRSNGQNETMDDEFVKMNLRDIKIQEKMIKEHLKDYDLSEDITKRILAINSEINSFVESSDDVARNTSWELESIEFDNLFNYGAGNKIDFGNLNGLVGIFGKSFSGKSSIVDSVLYTLFNNTSKSVRKNYDMINQHKDYASGKAVLTINDDKYVIERKSTKYTKKLYGETTEEAKTEVEFYKIDADGQKIDELNDESRRDTDKVIRNKIGNLEDFLVTSFAAQFGSLAFIDQKSTVRKKMLAKFLDLEFFEDKFRIANDQSADLRGALKMLEAKDYSKEYEKLSASKTEQEERLNELMETCRVANENLTRLKEEVRKIEEFILSVPSELEEISHVEAELDEKRKELNRAVVYASVQTQDLNDKQKLLEEFKEEIANFDLANLTKIHSELLKLHSKIADKFDNVVYYDNMVGQIEDAEQHLREAPCNSQYSSCYLVENSVKFLEGLEDKIKLREKLDKIRDEHSRLEEERDKLLAEDAEKKIDYVNEIKKKIDHFENRELPLLVALNEKESLAILSLKNSIRNLESKMVKYEENKEKIEQLEENKIALAKYKNEQVAAHKQVDKINKELTEAYSNKGYLQQKIENIVEERQKLEEMRKEFTAYDLYKKCMHSNGIPFMIIKKRLPTINSEISKILANVVDFEVFFESSDNRLEIYLKHPKHEGRLIETGSGAEKTLSATAIRLALLSISSLPKGDLFILDEPATELDDETKEGFLRILEMIKSYFSKVILISHLEPLKDIVDTEITIEKKNGYAHVMI